MAGRRAWESLAVGLATLGGAGRSPVVPGTAGTLAALPLAVIAGLWLPLWAYALATLLLAGLAIVTADTAARRLGGRDPGAVVIDEAAGLFVTLLGVPIHAGGVAAGFVLFRVMDVLKPPPARRAERLPGGWGIVVDDLVAGLHANIALRLSLALVRRLGA